MSKLDELIKEYCPNGVEYKKIGDIANYEQPSKYLVKSTDYNDNFKTPVLTAGQTFILGYTNETDGVYNASPENSVIIFDDFTGAFKWVDFPFKAKSSAMKMITAKNNVLIRYLFHLMGFLNYSSDEHKRLWISIYSELQVPVPPLEVQREIVRVLDSFTLLTAELTAELTARKKQYDFYRDKLLTSNRNIKTVKLGDVCTFVRGPFGGALKKEIFTTDGYAVYEQQHAIYRNLDFRYYIDKNKFSELKRFAVNPGDMIVSCSGTIGKTFVIPKNAPEGIINQALLKLTPNEELNVFYLQYFFENTISKILNGVARGGAIKNVPSVSELKLIELPLPSLTVQKKLVNVLNNFESICTDLNIGLPAEIEARQKQYEYYRDLLLTFAETGSTLMTDRQTDRQTELNAIKLLQYVFGYATVSLDYIADFRNGKGHEKSIVAAGKYIVVNSKFISTDGQVKKYSDNQICPLYANDILMVMSDLPNGRALAKCYLVDEDDKYTLNQRIGAFTVSRPDLVTTKYLYYILSRNPQLLRYDNGADQTNLRKADILNISIAIPTVKEQKKITEILDRFDILCNDLSTGLPAEIEARQKQYEYYRNKLLTFKEKQ